ncbi:MAG: tRNA (adenosine(37)-N6)-threonylcarbamoyltransferase complex transferase subunit TsaD [Patescibacteria group bacterium]
MLILGIESSCDETAVAVLRDRQILANLISSQLDAHKVFGGVVPELAARMHLEACAPMVRRALAEAGVSLAEIDLVCATRGPGLIGALLVGFCAAKSIAWALDKPFVGVNHITAHIYANFLSSPAPEPPLICLTVSGGHTDLFLLTGHGHGGLRPIGATRDDAAGECLDKAARVIGLGYPGGPAIERLAAAGEPRFALPRPVIEGSLDFSFSGLKTAVLHLCRRLEAGGGELPRADLAASIQETVVDGLCAQLRAAAAAHGAGAIALAGGVAANGVLRARAAAVAEELGVAFHVPPPLLCTDNAAMVACAGAFRLAGYGPDGLGIGVDPALRV